MAHEDPIPSAPPRYNEVFPEQHGDELPEIVSDPQTQTLLAPPSPLPRENNFTMIRFIFCWTGVATECSAVTCRLCGLWYILLGIFGASNVFLPYSLLVSVWPNIFLTLYMMAGISCVLLFIMWLCTVRFFYKTHPQKRLYDSQNYRLPQGTNSGYIVCLFVFSCSLFGAITMVIAQDFIALCGLFDPPVRCYALPYYVISITASMITITTVFLCFNCLCYFHFIKRNAGSIC